MEVRGLQAQSMQLGEGTSASSPGSPPQVWLQNATIWHHAPPVMARSYSRVGNDGFQDSSHGMHDPGQHQRVTFNTCQAQQSYHPLESCPLPSNRVRPQDFVVDVQLDLQNHKQECPVSVTSAVSHSRKQTSCRMQKTTAQLRKSAGLPKLASDTKATWLPDHRPAYNQPLEAVPELSCQQQGSGIPKILPRGCAKASLACSCLADMPAQSSEVICAQHDLVASW